MKNILYETLPDDMVKVFVSYAVIFTKNEKASEKY